MHPGIDQGPADGDYARYVERLVARASAAQAAAVRADAARAAAPVPAAAHLASPAVGPGGRPDAAAAAARLLDKARQANGTPPDVGAILARAWPVLLSVTVAVLLALGWVSLPIVVLGAIAWGWTRFKPKASAKDGGKGAAKGRSGRG